MALKKCDFKGQQPKCPFVGTYVRNIDFDSRNAKITVPAALRKMFEYRGSDPTKYVIIPRAQEVKKPNRFPCWLERFLDEDSSDLSLELTDTVTSNYDRYRLVRIIQGNLITIPENIKRKLSLNKSLEFIVQNNKVTLNETPKKGSKPITAQIKGGSKIRVTPRIYRSLRSDDDLVYIRPVCHSDDEKDFYIEITRNPKFPVSAYHKAKIYENRALAIDPLMLHEMGFDDKAYIKLMNGTAKLLPTTDIQYFKVSAQDVKLTIPRPILDMFRIDEDNPYLFLNIKSTQPKKTPRWRYWDIYEDDPKNYVAPMIRVELASNNRMIISTEVIQETQIYQTIAFIGRGDHIEMQLY